MDGVYIATISARGPYPAGHAHEGEGDEELLVVAGRDETAVNNAAVDEALELMEVLPNADIDFDLDWVDFDLFLAQYSSGSAATDTDRMNRIAQGEIVLL